RRRRSCDRRSASNWTSACNRNKGLKLILEDRVPTQSVGTRIHPSTRRASDRASRTSRTKTPCNLPAACYNRLLTLFDRNAFEVARDMASLRRRGVRSRPCSHRTAAPKSNGCLTRAHTSLLLLALAGFLCGCSRPDSEAAAIRESAEPAWFI